MAVFILACLGVVPLSGKIAYATEELAGYLGPSIGGLLNATFGNAAELIIAFFAVRAGLLDVVKASITGSILGNTLLVLGAALFAGGIKNGEQRFNRDAVGVQSAMLLVAVAALVIPDTFVKASIGLGMHAEDVQNRSVQLLSLGVAFVLIVVYVAGTLYSLHAHKAVFGANSEEGTPSLSKRAAVTMLITATVFVAVLSELLVSGIEDVVHKLGVTELFIGLILVPIVGNAAEHSSAVMLAMKNKVDVAFAIAVGSSTQIALFVAPLLVFISFLVGHPLTFIFVGVEIWSILLAVMVVNSISHDGQSNWLEGLMLLACFAIIALCAFFVRVV